MSLRDIVKAGANKKGGPEYATLNRLIQFYGKAMSTVVNMLDPQVIVIGGGLGNIDQLYKEGQAAVEKHVFDDRLNTIFLKPMLGDSAGVFGGSFIDC